jgi:hypothetical protein
MACMVVHLTLRLLLSDNNICHISAAGLTYLPEVSAPETDHSGSPDKKNEQHSVLVPDSQRSVHINPAPESPSFSVYVPDSRRSTGSPCLVPTLSQIYRLENQRKSICLLYTADLPFGGRGPSPGQVPIGSPTRNLPASPDTSGPTPLDLDEHRL